MIITDHAARRYVRRLAPSLTLDAARALLARVSRYARLLPQRTDAGQQLWQTTGALGAVLVVKHDRASGQVVVTVLSEGQTREADDEEQDEVRAAFERQERAREEQRRIDYEERGHGRESHWDRMAREHREAAERKAKRAQSHAELMAREQSAKRAKNRARKREDRCVDMARWAGVLP